MLLAKAIERNPGLLEAAIELHQSGAIPAGTHLVDLDAVADNAFAIARAAARNGIRAYAVTKQDGNEPHMTRLALDQGLDAVTAVEAQEAYRIHRFGFPLGNVGHTQQLPRHDTERILAMEPEYVTVYSLAAAQRVANFAQRRNRIQKLYVTIANADDVGVHDELIGGWTESTCVKGIRPLLDLPGVEIAGLTQHVTFDYESQDDPWTATPTEAFLTTLRARELLERKLGLRGLGLNCAGNINAVTLDRLSSYGVTEVEPGMALVGSGWFHALHEMPERPAQVYVSEITHHWCDHAYAVGGGFNFVWDMGGKMHPLRGLVGNTFREVVAKPLEFAGRPWYELHGRFKDPDRVARIGDTLLFVHLAQVILERCYVAAVSGIARGQPRLEALFDRGLTMLDGNRNPVPLAVARASVERVGAEYSERRKVQT